jgi:DNA polymerase III epsilon subunit-like protein
VQPSIFIPKRASDVHGITAAKLAKVEAEPFGTVFSAFVTWLKTVAETLKTPRVLLCAHNGHRFDEIFLRRECQRHRIPLSTLSCIAGFGDTLPLFRAWYPTLQRHTLAMVHEHVLQQVLANAHDGLGDVQGMHAILVAHARRMQWTYAELRACFAPHVHGFDRYLRITHQYICTKTHPKLQVKHFLHVPFADKATARQLGARWDPREKKWYAQKHALQPAKYQMLVRRWGVV